MSGPEQICLLPSDGWSWMAGRSRHEEDAVEYIRADTVAEMIRQAVTAEREACAKVAACDRWKVEGFTGDQTVRGTPTTP